MSPLLSLITFILFAPICSAWYFINSSQPSFKQRFYQILGKIKPDLTINRVASFLYIISFVLCLIWIIYWLVTL
jgi:beta-lactamase regulating signal transducer with metallopeptidase domain